MRGFPAVTRWLVFTSKAWRIRAEVSSHGPCSRFIPLPHGPQGQKTPQDHRQTSRNVKIGDLQARSGKRDGCAGPKETGSFREVKRTRSQPTCGQSLVRKGNLHSKNEKCPRWPLWRYHELNSSFYTGTSGEPFLQLSNWRILSVIWRRMVNMGTLW